MVVELQGPVAGAGIHGHRIDRVSDVGRRAGDRRSRHARGDQHKVRVRKRAAAVHSDDRLAKGHREVCGRGRRSTREVQRSNRDDLGRHNLVADDGGGPGRGLIRIARPAGRISARGMHHFVFRLH